MSQDQKSPTFLRPPIVTIMGHVDHGKTSLLDYIRKTKVAQSEAGGITQSIGAYQVSYKGKKITFIDTPGHAAFTKMRVRGGKVSDIVILVVSAVDGVKPQTKESISIIKDSKAAHIVVLTKSDLEEANPEKVKRELAENEVLVENYGGDVICCQVSSKTGKGVDSLLESITTLSEMLELKGFPDGDLEGLIIEAKMDPKRGPVFTGIVKNGTLKVGMEVFTSQVGGKIRALSSYEGLQVKEAFPGDPVEVLGFGQVPLVGDVFVDGKNRSLVESSVPSSKEQRLVENGKNIVNIILRADNLGSLEALEYSILELGNIETSVKILSKGTGDITESDVLLASSSQALILGFNARTPSKVLELSESLKVPIRSYKIIYELLDNLKEVIQALSQKEELKVKGRALVLQTFKLDSGDIVAGCKVLGGAVRNVSKIAVLREGVEEPVFLGKVKSLRRGKDEVSVVGKDVECGILLKPVFKDIKSSDIIEVQ